jgi:tRNA pseudouridine55 synthase
VLLVGVGRVTRLLRFVGALGKEYRGTVVFGIATDTLDASGAVLERSPMPLSRSQIEAVTKRFVGAIEQVPPMVSAVKVGGRRLHELARAGVEVERAPRPAFVERIDVESVVPGPYPEATVRVTCGSGTYIRTLAADLGTALGGCAHLRDLRRLRVGSFDLSEARGVEEIARDPAAALLSPAVALRDLPARRVTGDEARAIAHGATFAARSLVADDAGDGPFAMLDGASGRLLAVYERRGRGLRPAVVLVAAGGDDS